MAGSPVIDHQVAPPCHAQDELVQAAMRVLAADVFTRNVEHQKISLHLKRNMFMDLAETETAAEILGAREAVDGGFAQPPGLLRVENIQPGERSLGGRVHVSDNPRRISGHFRMRRNVSSHDGARAHHSALPDHQSGQNSGIRPNRSATLDPRLEVFSRSLLAAWKTVIRERRIRADEYVILHAQSVPQLDTALDRYPVPHDDVVLNERVIANVAVAADAGARKDMGIRPDLCSFANVIGFDKRRRVESASG